MPIPTCDRCGSLNAIPVEDRLRVEVPDKYDHLCRECAEEVNTHTLDDMTDDEIIAAIVDDSIGYASPGHAEGHLDRWKDGATEVYCERGHAVFDGDMEALMESARAKWCAMSEEKQERVLEFIKAWRERGDRGGLSATSMMYPTSGP